MQSNRAQAIQLRQKGYSYTEIHERLGVPTSTLSSWLSQVTLSASAKKRLAARVRQGVVNGLIKRNKLQTARARERAGSIRTIARNEIRSYSKDELRLIGASLYWAEGHKKPTVVRGVERTHHQISFANADPSMIRLFIAFLSTCLGVAITEIHIHVRVFTRQQQRSAVRWWSETLGVPKSCFDKPSIVVSGASSGKRPKNRLPYGTIQVKVYSTEKFHRLMGWIEGMQQIVVR